MPADKLHITLAGREHVVEAGTTAGRGAGRPAGPRQAAVAARVNGEPSGDLACARSADADTDVEPVPRADSPDGLAAVAALRRARG